VRDPERRMQDCYLFTTDLKATRPGFHNKVGLT
jgi:hypothetical protein